MICSAGSRRLLDQMAMRQGAQVRPTTLSAGPTLVKISDPIEDAEAVVAELDNATPEGRRRNRYLSRKRSRGLGQNAQGAITYDGRTCCLQLAKRLDPHLNTLPLPSRHVCPGCGTTWELQLRIREERPHGR